MYPTDVWTFWSDVHSILNRNHKRKNGMANGTHKTNNSDLAFVARCSISDLQVASQPPLPVRVFYNLQCTMIQWCSSSVDIIDLVGRLIFNQCVLQKSKYLSMVSLVK